MSWSAADLRGTAASLEPWWALLTADIPPAVAAELRPSALSAMTPPAGPRPPLPDEGAMTAVLGEFSRIGRELHDRGYGVASQHGSVAGVFVSYGGVPKRPVAAACVTAAGLEGDRQRTRRHHGRVWQALCLWSAEVVDGLANEGHPVFPGACGENLLLRGLDWATLRPGVRLRIGGVLAEVSLPTIPCKQIRPFFAGAAVRRVDHARYPGSSRWYASVLEPGEVAVGAAVVVEPDH